MSHILSFTCNFSSLQFGNLELTMALESEKKVPSYWLYLVFFVSYVTGSM